MSYLYVWQTRRISPDAARQRLAETLQAQCTLTESLCGERFGYRLTCALDEIWIGLIEREGEIGHGRWFVSERGGLVLSGIDEAYLDPSGPALDPSLGSSVLQSPSTLATHPGRFFVAAWSADDQRMVLASSATEASPAWHTSGPQGWAFGCRARPALDLVGRTPRLHPGSAGLYVSHGFIAGTEGLFEGTHRYRSRRATYLQPGQEPRTERYLTLGGLLGANTASGAVECSELLAERLRVQLAVSPRPLMQITGGRDSRLMVAAAHRAGYRGALITGGTDASTDVRIGAQVAARLGLEHERHTSVTNAPTELAAVLDRVVSWFEATESIQDLKNVGLFNILTALRGDHPSPLTGHQLFNGLGGEHLKGRFYGGRLFPPGYLDQRTPRAYEQAHRLMREPLREDVIDNGEGQIMQIMDEIDQEARELDATAAQWLDLYYWQHHTLQWGLDRSEAWSILGQRWMPLIDAHLISAAWSRPTKEKSLAQMSSEITTVLSPALSGLPYDKEFNLAPKQLAIQSVFDLLRHSGLFPYYRRARIEIQNRRASATPAGPKALLDLWDLVFHQSSAPAWPAVVSKAVLDTWLRTDTGSPQLWYLASIELFARAHALL